MSYFNIHTHTDYSNTIVIDSTNKVANLLDKAKDMGLSGIAITDHGNISSHIKALRYVKEKREADSSWDNFKLGLGSEIYLCENGRNKDNIQKGQKYPHFILVAKDAIGHEQIREITSIAWERLS